LFGNNNYIPVVQTEPNSIQQVKINQTEKVTQCGWQFITDKKLVKIFRCCRSL